MSGKKWIPEWKIIPVGDVTFGKLKLQRVIDAVPIPGCLTWEIDRSGPYTRRYIAKENFDYGCWPVPEKSGYACVFRRGDPDFPVQRAGGLAWTSSRTASCSYRPGVDSDLVLGLRIYHEILHCLLGSGEPDDMIRSPGFVDYLSDRYGIKDPFVVAFWNNPMKYEHDPEYQKEFYAYLMQKHFPEETDGYLPSVPFRRRLSGFVATFVDSILRLLGCR